MRNGAYNVALTTGLAIVASFVVVPFLFFLLVAGFELVRRGRTLYRWLPHYSWPTWQRTLAVAPWRRLNLSSFYNQVGHMTPEGALTLYDVPTLDADLGSIIVGPDHHVWFVEHTGLIGELSP